MQGFHQKDNYRYMRIAYCAFYFYCKLLNNNIIHQYCINKIFLTSCQGLQNMLIIFAY